MTEQPTTPPEPIQQSAFPTGRGVCWSAHPNIDGVVPPAEHYQPPARTRPADGWAKTGSVGASATLGSDEEPVTVPARAYDGEPNSQPGSNLAQLGVDAPVVDVTKPGFGIVSIAEARSWGIEPPPAVELRAMADDLNAHGGLDEAFVAGLLHAAVNDMPTPSPSTMKPVTYETIMEAMGKFGPLPLAPPAPIKLTREQWDAVPKTSPNPYGGGVIGNPFGVPVELVETVEESTPYRLANARPGGIVEIHGELTDAEFETLRADWLRAFDAKPRLSRWIVEADHEFVAHVNDGVDKAAVLEVVQAAARRPAKHQHIWSATSPMRCVDCRRYLRPWWRRTLDRARRWRR